MTIKIQLSQKIRPVYKCTTLKIFVTPFFNGLVVVLLILLLYFTLQ